MDIMQLGAIITAILGAPLLKELAAGYFKLNTQRLGDDVAIRNAQAQRITSLESDVQQERSRHEDTRAKLSDLLVKYEVLLVRFSHLEKTLEVYRQGEGTAPNPSGDRE